MKLTPLDTRLIEDNYQYWLLNEAIQTTYSNFQMNRPPVDLSPMRREALNIPLPTPLVLPYSWEMVEEEAFFSGKGLGVRFHDCDSYN